MIKNLRLINATITGRNHVSGLVGGTGDAGNLDSFSLSGVYAQNSFVGGTSTVTGEDYVGGLVGSFSISYNDGTIQNSVAFNSSLTREGGTGDKFGRVVGNNGGTLSRNYGFSEMSFSSGSSDFTPNPPVSSNGTATVHGAGFSFGTAYSTLFNAAHGWTSENWIIPGGNLSENGALPTLRNIPGQAQNPRGP